MRFNARSAYPEVCGVRCSADSCATRKLLGDFGSEWLTILRNNAPPGGHSVIGRQSNQVDSRNLEKPGAQDKNVT